MINLEIKNIFKVFIPFLNYWNSICFKLTFISSLNVAIFNKGNNIAQVKWD